MAVMALNGGSAVPLWNTWLDGMQEEAPEGDEIDVAGIQAIFAKALEELDDMSGAKVGDKTMMDALIPASQAIAAYAGSDEAGAVRRRGPGRAPGGGGQQAVRLQVRPGQELRRRRPSAPRTPGPPPWPISSRAWPRPERIIHLILNGRYSIHENEEVYQRPRDHHRRGAGGPGPGLPRHSGGGRPSGHQQGPGRRPTG